MSLVSSLVSLRSFQSVRAIPAQWKPRQNPPQEFQFSELPHVEAKLYGQAWLGDFGLAEVYEHSSNTREVTIPPAGRMGYLAPEYVYSAVPTEKTYVYSFGVVVLEVATGVDDDGTVVVDWVWDLREKGKKRPRMLKDQILYQRIREQRSGLLLLLALP
uniref:Protein kinase domain-containing protein n=1 Tax=Salix viminalis TaxID=40686 RepID=A0A6N2K2S6_SALVM